MDCPTKKKCFPNPSKASAALQTIKVKGSSADRPIRHYHCTTCGFWHLTSTPSDARQESKVRVKYHRSNQRRRRRADR